MTTVGPRTIDPTRARARFEDDRNDVPPVADKKLPPEHVPSIAPSLPPDVVRRLVELKGKVELAYGDSFIPRPVLIVDGMSPADVKQSITVGDCTVEATLASLARTEKGRAWLQSRVRAVPDASGDVAKYVVLLKVKDASGKFVDKPVDVDPHFMVRGHPGSKTDVTEVWPLVFEAAIAKELGGVDVLNRGGNVPIATGFITGKPAVDVPVKTNDKLGDALVDDFMAGRVQTLSTAEVDPKANPLGLVGNHAYTVVDVRPRQPVVQPDGTTKLETLVVVRNPWGFDDPRPMTVAEVRAAFGAYSVGDVP